MAELIKPSALSSADTKLPVDESDILSPAVLEEKNLNVCVGQLPGLDFVDFRIPIFLFCFVLFFLRIFLVSSQRIRRPIKNPQAIYVPIVTRKAAAPRLASSITAFEPTATADADAADASSP